MLSELGTFLIMTTPKNDEFYKHRNIDCANCPVGNFCCTLKVKLSFADRLRILLKKGLRTKEYADQLIDDSGWGIKLVNGDCYFLKRDGDKAYCTIYDARPKICRKFPHFFEDINDCRDIVKNWKRTVVDGVETTGIEMASKSQSIN